MGMASPPPIDATARLNISDVQAALRADGIVGVRLEVTRHEWGEAQAEFVAIGTAIRARNGQSYRNAKGLPFTSDLSGQDFWTLLRTGYRPVGMVMGN